MENYSIRIATPEDAKELVEVYAPYVLNTAVSFEYDVPTVREFERRIKETLHQYPYLVAEENGVAVGYAYAGAFHVRKAYARSAEISIYVRTDKREKGVGGQLYRALEKILCRQNFLNLYACIAYPEAEDEYLTKASLYFHERMGFGLVGRFHQCGYKFGRWYDMVWMEKSIGEHGICPFDVLSFNEIRKEFEGMLCQKNLE